MSSRSSPGGSSRCRSRRLTPGPPGRTRREWPISCSPIPSFNRFASSPCNRILPGRGGIDPTMSNHQVGVIPFPGSNGDHDALHALSHDVGVPTRLVDYRETDLESFGALVLPGGFSYGDYL